MPRAMDEPNRIIERVGRFGSPRKEEVEKGFPEEALFTKNGPNEATLMGAPEHISRDRRRRLDLPQARPLAVRRHRHEGRGRNPRAWSAGNGTATPRRSRVWKSSPAAKPKVLAPRALHRHDLPGPKGNFVFNAATIWWADGLSEPPGYVRPAVYTRPKGPDVRVQRITRNLLDRMRTVGRSRPSKRGIVAKTIHPPRGGRGPTKAVRSSWRKSHRAGGLRRSGNPAAPSARFSSPQR